MSRHHELCILYTRFLSDHPVWDLYGVIVMPGFTKTKPITNDGLSEIAISTVLLAAAAISETQRDLLSQHHQSQASVRGDTGRSPL